MTVVVSAGSLIYALFTLDRPNRDEIIALTTLGLLSAPAIYALPTERIVRSRWREPFFFAWSCADIALIALDRGL